MGTERTSETIWVKAVSCPWPWEERPVAISTVSSGLTVTDPHSVRPWGAVIST